MKHIRNFENFTFADFYGKNKWVKLSIEDRSKLKYELFDIINNAYLDLGGHVRINSPESIINDTDLDFWNAVDIDNDPKADVVIFSRKSNGNKISGWGHDGSKESRKEVINRLKSILRVNGFWIEVSDRPAEILIKSGCNFVNNKNDIRKLFPSTEINWLGNGRYTRVLEDGNETSIEYVVGRPLIDSVNESKVDIDNEISNVKNQLASVGDIYDVVVRNSNYPFSVPKDHIKGIEDKLYYRTNYYKQVDNVIVGFIKDVNSRNIKLDDILDDLYRLDHYVKEDGNKIFYTASINDRDYIFKEYIFSDVTEIENIDKPYVLRQIHFVIY